MWRVWGLILVVLMAGCAALPTDYPRSESTALANYQSTTMGKHWAAEEARHPGESGFGLLRYGVNAFNVRVAMVDLAEKTLDLQVYIWESDSTGRILADRLIRAADRGVRVRLLVDDMGLGPEDRDIAAMDAHPNIEIRVFNPFAERSKTTEFITSFNRVNHRMHNKIMIMDNSFSVVGGRNIGDHYFGVNPNSNFRDLDIAAVGPVVRDISSFFDYYWQGNWAVPIAVLVEREYTEADLQLGVASLKRKIEQDDYPYPVDVDARAIRKHMLATADTIFWAPGKIVWDDPRSIEEYGEAGEVIAALRRKLQTLEKSLTIESAYFIVRKRGVAEVKRLSDQGVKVRILTNSLASNDVLAAHAGHASRRKELLAAGAELYELRADSGVIKKTWKGQSRAGLHSKALVFDGDSLFVGSFNLDPRSANINTEAGLYVESVELASQLLEYMEEGVAPQNSYRLSLDENGDLLWTTRDEGGEVRYDKDPLSTFGQRLMSGMISILPVESQL